MSIPYTYSIHFKDTGQYYYGVQYGKHAHPSNLGKVYFSSSRIVKDLLLQVDRSRVEFKIRKVFKTSKQAFNWEKRVLRRLKPSENTFCLNQTRNLKEHIPKKLKEPSLQQTISDLFCEFIRKFS